MKVKSLFREYQVDVVPQIQGLEALLPDPQNTFMVVDKNLIDRIPRLCQKYKFLEILAVEDEKTLQGTEKILLWLQAHQANRKSQIIAVGGGITQDIVSFASHTYFRGIPWIFVPTTLLSQADSCIGSKYGVNLGSRKNQVGNYNPPTQVLLCPEFLTSLSDGDIYSGFGEMIRLAWTGGEMQFKSLIDLLSKSSALAFDLVSDQALMTQVLSGLETKKKIIEIDEFETKLRKILNYGHSFGHALETVTDHNIPHGLAVVWGMELIDRISKQYNCLSEEHFKFKTGATREIFNKVLYKNPKMQKPLSSVKVSQLIDVLKTDKKAYHDEIQLILNHGPGDLRIFVQKLDLKFMELVDQGLRNILNT